MGKHVFLDLVPYVELIAVDGGPHVSSVHYQCRQQQAQDAAVKEGPSDSFNTLLSENSHLEPVNRLDNRKSTFIEVVTLLRLSPITDTKGGYLQRKKAIKPAIKTELVGAGVSYTCHPPQCSLATGIFQ